MNVKRNEAGNLLPMTVTEGITVNVAPNVEHEFLMSTRDVAIGYGVSSYNIRQHKLEHSPELIEGKHFISGVSIPHTAFSGSSKGTMWTKRGVVRLGFFIKSDRAKLFRDWAEELVLQNMGKPNLFISLQKLSEPKRNHNRLTHERLLDIMVDICKIEDKELRLSISSKLMKGGQP